MTIIITGASKGVGLSLLQMFRRDGHNVIGVYNSTVCNDENYYKVNVSSFEEVSAWAEQ